MNDETYALRRSVMGVIYEAKRFVDLPRVEIRIVETPPCLLGYAYTGGNIIHISDKVASGSREKLVGTVLHELVHAVKAFGHDPKCPLMEASYRPHSESVLWDAFKGYF